MLSWLLPKHTPLNNFPVPLTLHCTTLTMSVKIHCKYLRNTLLINQAAELGFPGNPHYLYFYVSFSAACLNPALQLL